MYFSLGNPGVFFKVMNSGQKLNYKDHVSPTHLQLPSMAFWETAHECQLSCPCPQPAWLYVTTVPCAKQNQAVDTHPPVHTGHVRSSLPTTSVLTLWQMRKHSATQHPTVGDPHCLAHSGGSNVQVPPCSFGLYLLLEMWLQPVLSVLQCRCRLTAYDGAILLRYSVTRGITVNFFPYVFVCGYAECVVWFGVEISLTYKHIVSPPYEGFLSVWYFSLNIFVQFGAWKGPAWVPWAPLAQGLLLYLLLVLYAVASAMAKPVLGEAGAASWVALHAKDHTNVESVAPHRGVWHRVRDCVALCFGQSFPEGTKKAVHLECGGGLC